MLLNENFNYTSHKMLWAESVHMCKRMNNIMLEKISRERPFEIFYGEKPKIIGFLSNFGRIAYVMKRGNIKGQIKYKIYKAIMFGYTKKHTRDTYKFYNPVTTIMSRDIKWLECKTTDPAETMKILHNFNEKDLVPVIEELVQENKTHQSYPEDPLPVHVISDKGESAKTNENIKSSELT